MEPNQGSGAGGNEGGSSCRPKASMSEPFRSSERKGEFLNSGSLLRRVPICLRNPANRTGFDERGMAAARRPIIPRKKNLKKFQNIY